MESKNTKANTIRRTRSSGSKRFLLCFKGGNALEEDLDSLGPNLFTVKSFDKEDCIDRDPPRLKRNVSRKFSRIKTNILDTSLAKKIKRRKMKSSKAHIPRPGKTIDEDMLEDETKSLSQLNYSSASNSSSLSANSRPSLELVDQSNSIESSYNNKQEGNLQVSTKRCYGGTCGLCFLLVSLAALVFWGKIIAIFCTSAFLFVMPPKRTLVETNNVEVMEVGQDDKTKKMSVNGVLEKAHSCSSILLFEERDSLL